MPIHLANQLPGRKVILEDGKEYTWFSGTDYLGMGWNEEFQTYLDEGSKFYGSHFGSSRNNSLQLEIYAKAEDTLKNFVGAPASLTVSSGMWAGQLVMKEIENIGKNVFPAISEIQYHYSPKVHPALWGKDYVAHGDSWEGWAKKTIDRINQSFSEVLHIICSDSVGSPWVESLDFSLFSDLSGEKNIILIADDSHGLGVSGDSGSGVYGKLKHLENVTTIVVSSLNKAMGIPAGAIFTEEKVLDLLRASPWFSGASPFAPAYAYAFERFLTSKSYQTALNTLRKNLTYFNGKILGSTHFTSIANYPVFCSKDPALFQFLFDHGIMASSFSYPLATDLPVTRLAISATHQKEDLDKLAEVCIQFQS